MPKTFYYIVQMYPSQLYVEEMMSMLKGFSRVSAYSAATLPFVILKRWQPMDSTTR